MPRPAETPITLAENGDETHPSFGKVVVNRVSGQTRLFDSSIEHREYVTLAIYPATRKRNRYTDWIYHRMTPMVELNMSLAQWAEMVSSFGNGSGTSVTINYADRQEIPRPSDDESRLAVTAREVGAASNQATADLTAAVKAVEDAFEAKAGRREMAAVLNNLHHTAGNLPSNMAFAARRMTEHAEGVVTKAKADIEAMHLRAQRSAALQIQQESQGEISS